MKSFVICIILVLAIAHAVQGRANDQPARTNGHPTRPHHSHPTNPFDPQPVHSGTTPVGFGPPEIIRQSGEQKKVGGVNLGGWLVLEPWITPSLFEPWLNSTTPAVDEWTFTQLLGRDEARTQLEAHWDSWVQFNDLQTLSQAGITHVRIPVGYWLVSIESYEPYVDGSWTYLTRALEWCSQLGLKVLIDIHGLPGSQNGFDNSGRRGDIHWPDAPGINLLRSYYILSNLTSMLQPWSKDIGGPVHAIELVNEPQSSVSFAFVQNYYEQGYGVVRAQASNSTDGFDVFIHDSFRLNQWANFMEPPQYQNVYLDTHLYHVFDMGLLSMNESQHLQWQCTNVKQDQAQAAQYLWLVTGEWSLATTDCATWLNGFQKGSRWDGTLNPGVAGFGTCTGDSGNDYNDFTPDYIQYLRTFAEIQMDVYENAAGPGGNSAGWVSDTIFFWNFKTEGTAQWDFLFGLSKGYIPNPVTNRTHTCPSYPPGQRMTQFDGPSEWENNP